MFLCGEKTQPARDLSFGQAAALMQQRTKKSSLLRFSVVKKIPTDHTIFLPGQAKETNFIKKVTEYWEMGRGVGSRILFVKATDSKRVIRRNNGSLLRFTMGHPGVSIFPQKTKPIPHC
jgi:hypothetical protein